MKGNLVTLALAATCLIAGAPSGEAIKCFKCPGDQAQSYFGPCTKGDLQGVEVECPDFYHSCKREERYDHGNSVLYRGCDQRVLSRDECEANQQASTCWCKNDHCNGSQATQAAAVVIFLTTMMVPALASVIA